jgi:Uma2 family endonuclease
MREWTDNGTMLAWLIDPERRAVEIYRPMQAPEVPDNASSVQGAGTVAGFTLELQRVREPLLLTRHTSSALRIQIQADLAGRNFLTPKS